MAFKTMIFCYAVAVALAVIGTSVALPTNTINIPPALEKENVHNGNMEQPTSFEVIPVAESTDGTDTTLLKQGSQENQQQDQQQKQEPQQQQTDQAAVVSEFPVINTATSDVSNVNTESNSADTVRPTENISELPHPSFTVAEFEGQTPDVPKKPLFTDNTQTVKFNPFFMEIFQPFQPIQPFQPFHNNPSPNYETQPFRYPQYPQLSFGAPVNTFDPFSFMQSPSIYHPINTYANIFRNMLESLDKSMMQMENPSNTQNMQIGSEKNGPKTTTKTEIIDGHVVQTNETTYSNGDGNHKSFYHIKKIQVVPENKNQKIDNEKVTTMTNEDAEFEKMETNEIKRDPFDTAVIANAVADNNKNLIKKVEK